MEEEDEMQVEVIPPEEWQNLSSEERARVYRARENQQQQTTGCGGGCSGGRGRYQNTRGRGRGRYHNNENDIVLQVEAGTQGIFPKFLPMMIIIIMTQTIVLTMSQK